MSFLNATALYDITEIVIENITDTNETDWFRNATFGNVSTSDAFNWEIVLPRFRARYIEDFYGEYYKWLFHVSFVVCIIGYITNCVNVMVLATTPMAHSMNLFLLVLSATDILHITTQFSHIVHYLSGFKMFPDYEWVLFYIVNTYFETFMLFAVNWLAVAIGVWRFVAITWPLHSRDWCSKGRAKKVIVCIFILSAILATPVFAVITYKVITYQSRALYDKVFSDLATKNNRAFLKFYWSVLLFEGLVPSILLAVLTFGLFRNIYIARVKRNLYVNHKKSSSAGGNRTTVMLTILLLLYVLSNFPDGCLVLLSLVTNGDDEVQNKYRHATDIVRVFMLGNNSVSFFIYYGVGEGFRTRFHKMFCCCFVQKRLRSRDESGRTTVSEITRSRASVNSERTHSVIEKPGPVTML